MYHNLAQTTKKGTEYKTSERSAPLSYNDHCGYSKFFLSTKFIVCFLLRNFMYAVSSEVLYIFKGTPMLIIFQFLMTLGSYDWLADLGFRTGLTSQVGRDWIQFTTCKTTGYLVARISSLLGFESSLASFKLCLFSIWIP